MPDDSPHIPPEVQLSSATLVPITAMPVALQIFFDEGYFNRCKEIARYLSGAKGFVPTHLEGNAFSCFAVVSRSLTWKLDPFAVAQSTYEVGGKIGYYGTLCQAILEASGRLVGGVKYKHYGEWSQLVRKFRFVPNSKGSGSHPEPAWKDEEEIGLGVEVSAQIKDEVEPRVLRFDLVQAWPRNSVLWATDPRTQIQYTAVRRFATTVAPSLFMGVPFDRENVEDWAQTLRDVTPPRPDLREYGEHGFVGPSIPADSISPGATGEPDPDPEPPKPTRRSRSKPDPTAAAEPAATSAESSPGSSDTGEASPGNASEASSEAADKPWFFSDADGVVHEFITIGDAVLAYAEMLGGAKGVVAIDAAWENGALLIAALRQAGENNTADDLAQLYNETMAAADTPPFDAPTPPPTASEPPAYDVLVPPMNPIQTWYNPAKKMLEKMDEDQRPPVDYARFEAVNAASLQELRERYNSFSRFIDDRIAKGKAA